MKDEIKVNEYIRTYKGDIAKVLGYIKSIHYNTTYNEDCVFTNYEVDKLCDRKLEIADCDIKKHSLNKIELLEVGDVIRYKINNVAMETKGYLTGITEIEDKEMLENIKKDKNYHILSIVTKEQFELVKYNF